MWVLTAFVMIYKAYPSYSDNERQAHQVTIPRVEIPLDSLLFRAEAMMKDSLPTSGTYTISLSATKGRGLRYELSRSGDKLYYSLNGSLDTLPCSSNDIKAVEELWGRKVQSIDTIAELDQWTPFPRLKKDLPFYCLNLLGDDGLQVYLSSKDGRVITEHTRSERIWSWLGCIPHWLYFTQLRQRPPLWRTVIIILAALCVIATLTGCYMGLSVLWRTRRSKKGLHSPYRKPYYYWHHILGLIIGLALLIWLFSGMMSVVRIPTCLSGGSDNTGLNNLQSGTLKGELYQAKGLDSLLKGKEILKIEWTSIGGIPLLKLIDKLGKEDVYRAYKERFEPLNLSKEEVSHLVSQAYSSDLDELSLLNSFDEYYISRLKQLDFPVYRAIINDRLEHYVYLNPKTAVVKSIDRGRRIRLWVYTKPHGLKFPWLMEHIKTWTALTWGLLIICTLLMITSVVLSVNYLKRRFAKRKKKS